MKLLACGSIISLVCLGAPLGGSAIPPVPGVEAAGGNPVVVAIRPSWPVAREASGHWGVIGEAVTRNDGKRAVTIRSVTVTVEAIHGRTLLEETFDSPEGLGRILGVFGRDASGGQVRRPAGTVSIMADETAVMFVSALVDPGFLPRMARVSVRFSSGPARQVAVPLDVFEPRQPFGWPLRLGSEPWLAFNTAGNAHHWSDGAVLTERNVFVSQRFALDVAQVDAAYRTHPEWATGKESYYAWGEDVLSAGWGRVVAVVADQPDLEIGEAPSPARHPAGNHVVVQHGRALFSVYAHLQQWSLSVGVGDRVERGQVLGRVGNSGSSTEPHLHVHFTDRWAGSSEPLRDFYYSQGVPALFWGAQVLREGALLPLHGATPLEFDLIVPDAGPGAPLRGLAVTGPR